MVASNSTNPAASMSSNIEDTGTPLEMQLGTVFRRNCIELIRPATGKSSAISLLVQALAREEQLDRQHAGKIICQLIERERHSSSAIGKGLAFPHLRTKDVSQFVGAIGVAPEGIHFGSLDKQPTQLVFLTLTPWENREQHVALLSRLVRLMQDKAVNLQMAQGLRPQGVYDYLMDLGDPASASAAGGP